MNILITGGCGYIGTKLIEHLKENNFNIRIIDTKWFGNRVKKDKNIKIIKKNYRYINSKDLKKIDAIIHLANIANDPAAEISSKLTWEVNVLYMKNLLDLAINLTIVSVSEVV